jgi:hypothetical protein
MKMSKFSQPTAGLVIDALGFAATPLFAALALLSVHSPGSIVCSSLSAMMPISDMALMYFLMSFLHLTPWLRSLSQRLAARTDPINTIQGD